MSERTAIAWCDSTFNPWIGCEKVSPACDHCYAESWAKRIGKPQLWNDGQRQRPSANYWRQPLKWNREAERSGVRRRVFCASLADVFDNVVPDRWRLNLFRLIAETPHLDWLLLTKRIGNAHRIMDHTAHLAWPIRKSVEWTPAPNVWLGISVVNQVEADRDIPKLLATPAAIRFLSCEPLLGPIDLRLQERTEIAKCCSLAGCEYCDGTGESETVGLHWVIAGGESGPHARPMLAPWARDLHRQCSDLDIAFFMKQGSQANWGCDFRELESFPRELQVREWPR